MELIFNILKICFLLETSFSMRDFHIPHGYLDSLAMQHDNYQHYDSYASEDIVLRSRRKKYYRNRANSDYSDSRHDYKWQCKCSCAKCKKPQACCINFCSVQCALQSNILVVPYPVPYMPMPMPVPIGNQTATDSTISSTLTSIPTATSTPTSTSTPTTTSTPTATSTTETTETTNTEIRTSTRQTLPGTRSTVAFYVTKGNYKRFRIMPEKKIRRNMGGNMRPNEFKLPKYGIVPIPENLAIKLMQQIRNDQKNDQFRKRLNKNLLNYRD